MSEELDFGFSLRVEGSEAALAGVKKVADAMVLAKVDAAEFGTAASKAMKKAAKEAASLLNNLSGVRGEISRLVKGMGRDFERMGVKVSGVSRDFQAMKNYATGSINAITASVGKNTRSLSGMSSAAREAMRDIGKLASAKPIKLRITREVQDAVSGSSRSVANDFVSSTVTNSRGQSIPIYGQGGAGTGKGNPNGMKFGPVTLAKMTVNRLSVTTLLVSGMPGQSPADQQNNQSDEKSKVGQYVKYAAAAVTGLTIGGFAGTVEGNKFQTELTLMMRELAAIAKPLMTMLTDLIQSIRKWLERLSGTQQNLLLAGGMAVGGVMLAKKLGVDGALFDVAKGAGAIGMAGAKAGAPLAAAAAPYLLAGAGVQAAINARGIGKEQKANNALVKNLKGGGMNEADRLLAADLNKATGEMSGDEKVAIRAGYIQAAQRQANYAGYKEDDGSEMGWFGRRGRDIRGFGNLTGISQLVGLEDDQLEKDRKLMNQVRVADAAAAGQGKKNPFGDLGKVDAAEMAKLAQNGDHRSVLLAQAGFGAAGGTREELQTNFLLNDTGGEKAKGEGEKMLDALNRIADILENKDKPENNEPVGLLFNRNMRGG